MKIKKSAGSNPEIDCNVASCPGGVLILIVFLQAMETREKHTILNVSYCCSVKRKKKKSQSKMNRHRLVMMRKFEQVMWMKKQGKKE